MSALNLSTSLRERPLKKLVKVSGVGVVLHTSFIFEFINWRQIKRKMTGVFLCILEYEI